MLQQYVNQELPNIQAGFRRGRGTRDQIANIHWIIEKAREFQKKTFTSASLTTRKPLTVWITTNCGKFFKRWEYQTTYLTCLLRNLYVDQEETETDTERLTGSKLRREYDKTVYCHLAYLTLLAEYIMQNARLGESQAEIKIARPSINNLRYADDTTLMAVTKEPLDECERGE